MEDVGYWIRYDKASFAGSVYFRNIKIGTAVRNISLMILIIKFIHLHSTIFLFVKSINTIKYTYII